ncbi:MAG: hypothetical protein ACK4GN_04070 [Runella sp.]
MKTFKTLAALFLVVALASACTETKVEPQKGNLPTTGELPPKVHCGNNCA